MPEAVTLVVTRYRPEQESEPTTQSFEVPFRREWVVLDALNYVKDRLDGSLSFRWSCRMGVCGSCGMVVNGEPKLTCGAFLGDFLPGPIRVEPLRFFPVIRDLIVDIGDFLRKLRSVKPWLVRLQEKPLAEGEYRQTPDQLDADQGSRDRLEILSGKGGIWECTFVGQCTEVCPKHVDPARAIQQYKLTSAMHWLMPWAGGSR